MIINKEKKVQVEHKRKFDYDYIIVQKVQCIQSNSTFQIKYSRITK